MKYQVFFKAIDDSVFCETFHGDNPGEAFASCLLKNPNATLIKCKKGGDELGDAFTEWFAPPVQRKPEKHPSQYHNPIPKYKQEKDPMPSMREWYEKHKPRLDQTD